MGQKVIGAIFALKYMNVYENQLSYYYYIIVTELKQYEDKKKNYNITINDINK